MNRITNEQREAILRRAAAAPREPLDVIARALRLLEEAARRRDVGELTARDLERNARQLLRVALGVGGTDA